MLHGHQTLHASTDSHGAFAVQAPPDSYQMSVAVRGYGAVSLTLKLEHDSSVDVALEPIDSPKFRQIGSVTVDGRLTPIEGVVPAIDVSRADFDRLGDNRVVEGLQDLPGATFTRPDGGASSAISVASLRGPDPSESLVALDGQLLNDGNTGDLDLSQFPVAGFSSVNVTEGLGPQDTNGSNTFGGAINFVSLTPTQQPHAAFSISGGSFGQSEAWFNASGTHGKLGYAAALDDQHEAGYVNETVPLYSTTDPACQPCATPLGSSVASHLGLANLTYTFSERAAVSARAFLLGDLRDQSSSINGINQSQDFASSGIPLGAFVGPGDQTFAQVIRAYQVRGRAPLGSGELTAAASESDNSVTLAGNPSSAYDVTHEDRRYNGQLNWGRTFDTSAFAFGGYTQYESLQFIAPSSTTSQPLTPSETEPLLGQTINVLFARGGFTATPKLRLDGGVYESRYTSFGSNLDARFGAVYNADPKTALRFSMGTGFRAPLLIERYEFPLDQLPQDASGVFIGQGSPNEKPEHATEYELGASHEFASSTVDLSLYQTSLRNPIEIFYPTALAASGACLKQTPADPVPGCVSYNSNVGNAVYQGVEVRYLQRLSPQHLFLTASYGLNVAYPKNLNAAFSNPTSGGDLVDNQQFLGIPQQQGSVQLDWTNQGWHAATALVFRGNNNELHQGPFGILDALIGRQIAPHVDFSLAGTNLTNAVAGRFTVFGAGVPYYGVTGEAADNTPINGNLPTDALYLEPFGIRAILTVKE